MQNTEDTKQKAGILGSHTIAATGWLITGLSMGIGYTQGFSVMHGLGAAAGTLLGIEFTRKTL
jgi:hypothetical protein